MADKQAEERKKRVAAFLAPYQGKQGLIFLPSEQGGLGIVGASLLHELFAGNSNHAAAYLDYALRKGGAGKYGTKQVSEHWAKCGLKPQGHIKVHNGFAEGEHVSTLQQRYLNETSRPEEAPVKVWKLPVASEYGTCPCVSDLHYGPREMAYAQWLETRDWIRADKTRRWMYLGDAFDTATKNSPSSRNYLSQEEAETLFEHDIADIADQCLVMLSGNHEARLARETGVNTLDPLGRIAEKYGIHYGGLETMLRIRMEQGKRSESYDGYLHHGGSAATTLGGQLAALERAVRNFRIEYMVFGHTHAKIVAEVQRIMMAQETRQDDQGDEWAEVGLEEIVIAYAGSYLGHKHGGYSRDKLFSPANLGSISLHFYASRHSVHGRK